MVERPASGRARLAIDIGGTFTDLALERGSEIVTAKVLTTPSAPEEGVLEGMRTVLAEAKLAPSAIGLVIHGTTLATNALIERKGARTALITTGGFRDVLALRNESRYDQYDLNIVLPEPLIPRYLRLGVPERVDNKGRVLLPLDEEEVWRLIPFLRREKVESIAIGYLHGFVNPAHEQRTAEILSGELPGIPISLASEVSPEMREWERFSTTAANAYVQPLMQTYLRKLENGLKDAGIAAPLLLMLSGGNLATVETACRFPVRLVESGPAGGAIFAASVARLCGLESVLSFDMGGTTAKICLIDGHKPQTARSFEVARVGRFKKGSGLPVRIPVIEMVEIGAGGGSIAHVDGLGRLSVGPESAGADPGPACYGRGGTRPAVTDANLVLGRYDPGNFAGGSMKLDSAAAEAALLAEVGRPLNFDIGMAALGVIEVVDENMTNAARVHAIESGKSNEGRTVIAFGGGGPVHAARIAEKIGVQRVIIPSGAGVGSAIGFLRAQVGYEVVRSFYQRLGSLDIDALNKLLAAMSAEAAPAVALASSGAETFERRIAYMRYVGQGHEIAVPLPPGPLGPRDADAMRVAYDAEYTRFYDRPVPGCDIEVLSYGVTVAAVQPPAPAPAPAAEAYRAKTDATRRVRDTASGSVEPWAVYERNNLRPGAVFSGPAIVAEAETSTLVGTGWSGRITAEGYIELVREMA
jgi:N-methylhydantoinase A